LNLLTISQERKRKLIHLGSSVIPVGYWIAGRETAIVTLFVMTVVMLLVELSRMKTVWGRRLYQRFFGSVTRPSEAHRPTGGTYVFLGYLLTAILFPPVVALPAMFFMSIGDTAAAVVGQRFGRIPIGGKTLEGTLACFFVCLLIAIPTELTLLVTVAGPAAAAVAELIPWPYLNDNIAIPVFSAGAMTLLMTAGL
jgi:dolichol kinase